MSENIKDICQVIRCEKEATMLHKASQTKFCDDHYLENALVFGASITDEPIGTKPTKEIAK